MEPPHGAGVFGDTGARRELTAPLAAGLPCGQAGGFEPPGACLDVKASLRVVAAPSATSINVPEQPLQHVCAVGYRVLNGRSQELAVGA